MLPCLASLAQTWMSIEAESDQAFPASHETTQQGQESICPLVCQHELVDTVAEDVSHSILLPKLTARAVNDPGLGVPQTCAQLIVSSTFHQSRGSIN